METEYAIFEWLNEHVLFTKVKDAAPTDKLFSEYLKGLETFLNTLDRRIVIIHDINDAQPLPEDKRIAVGELYSKHQEELKKYIIAIIYVAPSREKEFLLEGIFRVGKPLIPTEIVLSNKVAERMASEMIEKDTLEA